jgi:hypothetical protein
MKLPTRSFSFIRLLKLNMINLKGTGTSDDNILKLTKHMAMRTVHRHSAFPLNRVPKRREDVKVYRTLLAVDSESGWNTNDALDFLRVMVMAARVNHPSVGAGAIV